MKTWHRIYVLISSLLSFRRVKNIRYLELNIPQVCMQCLYNFYGIGITRLYLDYLWESIVCDVLNRCASFQVFMWVHSFWCHLVNSNDCSKTVFKYSDFLLLELKNIVGILEFVLPVLNIEESHLLAILLDRNSKHAEQAQRLLSLNVHP